MIPISRLATACDDIRGRWLAAPPRPHNEPRHATRNRTERIPSHHIARVVDAKMHPRVRHRKCRELEWEPRKRNRIAECNGSRRRHRGVRRRKRRRGRSLDCLGCILEVWALALGDQLDAIVDAKRPPDGDRSRNRRACIALGDRNHNAKRNPTDPTIAKP